MSAQLKYSFKKENALFFRTFKFWGIVLAIFGFAVFNPLSYKLSGMLFKQLNSNQQTMTAAVRVSDVSDSGSPVDDLLGGMGIGDMAAMYTNADSMVSLSLVNFTMYSLLIILLVMMSVAGGEQKKRAMIVPMCSGLKFKNYLIPKFVLYPLWVFALTFLGGLTAGGLCNALADEGEVGFGLIALGSLLIAVYMSFIVSVYLALGISTSRPGLMAGAVFIGQTILQSMLEGMGLGDYQPFTTVTVVGGMFAPGYDLDGKIPSILVSVGLSIVIGVLMFVLALGVLNAKKIDNSEEEKPAF